MTFHHAHADLFIPDNVEQPQALSRTTHLCISAHQDDLEIMGFHGILQCYGRSDQWFSGVVCTNGAGSPRAGVYADYTDEDMQRVRLHEQRTAASIGKYAAMLQLGYPSSALKDPADTQPVEDLAEMFTTTRPRVVYTHNPADKHTTHVAVLAKVVRAIRALPPEARPEKLYGCEIWRDLDWLPDERKVVLDVSGRDNLAAALLGVFDSQIAGGKRYDLATMGRRRAHATYHEAHESDAATGLVFAMDLTPLIQDDNLDIAGYVAGYIQRFADDVSARIGSVS